LKEGITPVKQKLQRTCPDMVLKVKDEMSRQWGAGFLEVVTYP